jgi:DNA-binding CsgD family transcriptional regulator
VSLDEDALEAASAIYGAIDGDEIWSARVGRVLRTVFDAQDGLVSYRYSDGLESLSVDYACGVDLPAGMTAVPLACATLRQSAAVSREIFARTTVSCASEIGPVCLYHLHEVVADHGFHDLHGVHVPMAGGGYVFASLARRERALSAAFRLELERVRRHIVAGAEQRRALARRDAGPLSPREREVLEGLARGLSRKEVAYELGISASTVRVLLQRAARKLEENDHDALIRRFGRPRTR